MCDVTLIDNVQYIDNITCRDERKKNNKSTDKKVKLMGPITEAVYGVFLIYCTVEV
jgi:hypothetical protein